MKVEITKNTIIKDLVEKHPSTVEVFRKHKLLIAGGVRGPNEPLGFFAKAHDVDYDELVKELHEAIEQSPEEAQGPAPVLDVDRLYEKYVKAAIVLILTAGCTFGATMLSYIAIKGDFTSIPHPIIQAHGFAQLFGWLGLCIMGFGYYILPRVKGTELYANKLPEYVFWLMVIGLVLRTVFQPIPDSRLTGLLLVSGVVISVAVILYAYGIIRTIMQSANPPEVFDKFFAAAIIWFVIASLVNLAMTVHLFISPTNEIPQTIFAPFVHLFLFGFAVMFIFAINLRTVYAFLDLEKPITRLANRAFVILNIAVPVYFISTAFGYDSAFFQRVTQGSIFFIAFAGFTFIYAIRIFGRQTKELEDIVMDRSYEKAIKAAYAWLVITLFIFVLSTFCQPERAYLFRGSANHALTVGFITMMIIGYSSKMIPTFTGIDLYSRRLSDLTFIIMNAGIFLRVFSQVMVSFIGGPFYVTNFASGWIEVTGLTLFSINLWKTMNLAAAEDAALTAGESPAAEQAPKEPFEITKNSKIYDIIETYPQTLDVFLSFGFNQLKSPIARKTIAKFATVDMASKMHNVDLNKLLDALKEKCR